jgi:two-component system, NarL family, response regulator LiaR
MNREPQPPTSEEEPRQEEEMPASGPQRPPARLLIADDHDLVREGLRAVLGGEEDLEVVGEARDGQEALQLCRSLEPDLVLMDVRMPKSDGLEATRAIKEEMPGVSVVMVTMHENPDYLLEAIRAGAAGYILKDAEGERLVGAVRRTLSGESPLAQELAMQLLSRMINETREDEPQFPKVDNRRASVPGGITTREIEVLRLLAQGRTNPEIAQELGISRGTVKIHVQHIIAKLGVSDRTQAAVRAIELGLLDPESRP